MIEIINGSPTTLETLNLALLGQKIDKESKVGLKLIFILCMRVEIFRYIDNNLFVDLEIFSVA